MFRSSFGFRFLHQAAELNTTLAISDALFPNQFIPTPYLSAYLRILKQKVVLQLLLRYVTYKDKKATGNSLHNKQSTHCGRKQLEMVSLNVLQAHHMMLWFYSDEQKTNDSRGLPKAQVVFNRQTSYPSRHDKTQNRLVRMWSTAATFDLGLQNASW